MSNSSEKPPTGESSRAMPSATLMTDLKRDIRDRIGDPNGPHVVSKLVDEIATNIYTMEAMQVTMLHLVNTLKSNQSTVLGHIQIHHEALRKINDEIAKLKQ